MLSSTLFSKFPTIGYNNEIVTNITVRLKFAKMVEDNIYVFYPYTVKEGERADVIAHNYYGDASYSWLIYLANNIHNPLEEWPRSEEQLQRYIETTYGSQQKAYEKFMFYRVEWASDDSMLSLSAYNALPQALKKYWVPEYSSSRQILRYTRSQEDWIIDTNKIVKLTTTMSGNVSMGSYIYQLTSSAKSASGEVIRVEGSDVYVKHVVGEFVGDGKTLYIDDLTVGTCLSTDVVSSAFAPATYSDDGYGNIVATAIPAIWTTEENYWAPVTAYDYEMELNESKKTVRLVDAGYIDTIERDIRMILAS